MNFEKNIKIDEETWKELCRQKIDRNFKRIAEVIRDNSKVKKTSIKLNIEHLREELSELEHMQWTSFTQYISKELLELCTICTKNRDIEALKFIEKILVRWKSNWKPYNELAEEEKEKDRIWADKILELIKNKTGE